MKHSWFYFAELFFFVFFLHFLKSKIFNGHFELFQIQINNITAVKGFLNPVLRPAMLHKDHHKASPDMEEVFTFDCDGSIEIMKYFTTSFHRNELKWNILKWNVISWPRIGYPQGPPGGYPQGPQGGYPQGPPGNYPPPQSAYPPQPGYDMGSGKFIRIIGYLIRIILSEIIFSWIRWRIQRRKSRTQRIRLFRCQYS